MVFNRINETVFLIFYHGFDFDSSIPNSSGRSAQGPELS